MEMGQHNEPAETEGPHHLTRFENICNEATGIAQGCSRTYSRDEAGDEEAWHIWRESLRDDEDGVQCKADDEEVSPPVP